MNWVDLVVIAVVIVSGLLAFMRGFVRELLGIVAWVGAVAVAVWAFPIVQPSFRQWISNPELADPAALLAVFVLALIVLSIVASLLGSVVRESALGGIDRTLGMVFGLLRGAVVVIAAYVGLGMVMAPDRWPEPLMQARTLPYTYGAAVWTVQLLPVDYRPNVRPPPGAAVLKSEELLQPQPQGNAIGKP